MVLKYNFKGLMAPVFTPFTESLEINYGIISLYANYLKKHGVKGILVNGTTGEGVSLSVNERKKVTEEWVKVSKETKQSLMIHIGGVSLADITDMARHAEQLKVGALLCLPDLFFKPKTTRELINYVKLVAEAAPKTPIFYYHIPAYTGVNIEMGDFVKFACEDIPNFSGIKFTHTNLDEGANCISVAKYNDITIFLGADQLLLPAVTIGFDSAIAAALNIWPDFINKIMENAIEKNLTEGVPTQFELNMKIVQVVKKSNWLPAMKAAMKLASGIDMGLPRPPLTPLPESHLEELIEMFSEMS